MTRPALLARPALGLLWCGVIPALLTALVLQYLIPPSWHPAAQGPLEKLSRLRDAQPLVVGLTLFVGLAAIGRYWSGQLPADVDRISQQRGNSSSSSVSSFVLWIAGAVLLALLLRTSVIQSSEVLGGSMLPTLRPGDYLATNKLAYGVRLPGMGNAISRKEPRRGDVIVFENHEGGPAYSVKRVIGLPGDRITMKDGPATINGWKVPNCRAGNFAHVSAEGRIAGPVFVEFLGDAAYLTLYTASYRPAFGPYEVKPGEVFVVGDNRTTSHDSRNFDHGRGAGVPESAIAGRAERIVLGTLPNGQLDLTGGLQKLGTQLRAYGIDVSSTQSGIQLCLSTRPKNTLPPSEPQREGHAK